MTLPRTLEKPILEAIIRYAYALREDEEAALLSAFLLISYHFHREAVEWMLPGENYEQYISEQMEQTEQTEVSEPASGPQEVFSSEARSVEVKTITSGPVQRSSSLAGRIKEAVAALVQSARRVARRREIAQQEEEEAALFSTIESVAFDVNREAFEQEIIHELGGGNKFLTAREWVGEKVAKVKLEPAYEGNNPKRSRSEKSGKARGSIGAYIDCMDEELMITRRIIDRNRAASQEYIKAQAV